MTSKSKKTKIEAACRVDFAGGTVDIWPLYLNLGGLELVNMALNLHAESEVLWKPTRAKSHKVTVISADMKCERRYTSLTELGTSLDSSTTVNPLRWINRLVHHHLSSHTSWGEWEVRTSSQVPPGSGLGGSSTLGIGLSWALLKTLGARKALLPWGVQQTVRDLEAREIEHPAGDQDYVPALFGGMLIFKLGPHERSVERLPPNVARTISGRCALIYTGKPHHSGINNWQVYKAFIDGDRRTCESLKAIRNLSSRMATDLRDGRLGSFDDLVNEEWSLRQKLAEAVNAPVLDEAWSFGRRHGAVARKACGAGGGGCLLLVFPDAKTRDLAIKQTLPDSSWSWLAVACEEKGLYAGR
jgi:D-glycero-alpha-D-manno-heptose-7-phosphate kinase